MDWIDCASSSSPMPLVRVLGLGSGLVLGLGLGLGLGSLLPVEREDEDAAEDLVADARAEELARLVVREHAVVEQRREGLERAWLGLGVGSG